MKATDGNRNELAMIRNGRRGWPIIEAFRLSSAQMIHNGLSKIDGVTYL